MFKELHGLAQNAPLMITAVAEDDQLRVSVSATYPGGKAPTNALRPMTILATPEELDADFSAALAIWRAPKRSVLEQAQNAMADDQDDGAGAGQRKPAENKGKPGRKPKSASAPAAPEAGAAVLGDDDDKANSGAPVGDTLTKDMFNANAAGADSPQSDAAEAASEPANEHTPPAPEVAPAPVSEAAATAASAALALDAF